MGSFSLDNEDDSGLSHDEPERLPCPGNLAAKLADLARVHSCPFTKGRHYNVLKKRTIILKLCCCSCSLGALVAPYAQAGGSAAGLPSQVGECLPNNRSSPAQTLPAGRESPVWLLSAVTID
ncbi:hypothetical protein XENOCAPTIV_010750 [Xenoophorus captivus]|uniref:Uncharacterized protein n=1 Tax=Xenoophorus captivus TaxID=1517983 RepID=A0ABV0Q4U6_9TELE